MRITRSSYHPYPDALSLFLANEGCALFAVNVFLQEYPSALSGLRDRDDLISDAMLVLWHCCERYDASKDVPLAAFALQSIRWKLFTKWKQSTLRTENGQKVRIRPSLCLSEPVAEGSQMTFADCVPAESGGGRWGSDGLSALLHRERIEKARVAWDAKAPWLRAKCPGMAAELEAVTGEYSEYSAS